MLPRIHHVGVVAAIVVAVVVFAHFILTRLLYLAVQLI